MFGEDACVHFIDYNDDSVGFIHLSKLGNLRAHLV